jgi:hypothetical protein
MIHHNGKQHRERELVDLPEWLSEEFTDYPHFDFMAWYGDYGIYVTMYEVGYRDSIVDEWYYPNTSQTAVFLLVREEIRPLLYKPLSPIWTDYSA